ncbi:hypothetical protein KY342_05985 [Candidatus Woesearchaeota archaeon]|nr:hypothetical protein [Candidatus Woesearchaeota archaeon]
MENYFPKELGKSVKEPRAYAKPLPTDSIEAIGAITASEIVPYFSFSESQESVTANSNKPETAAV